MDQKFSERTRPDDELCIQIPELRKDTANIPIVMAVLNREINVLKKLLNNGWPNKELQQFILPYFLGFEKNYVKAYLSNRSELIKFLVQKGANTNYTLGSRLDFETIKTIGEAGGNLKCARASNDSFANYTFLHQVVLDPANQKWEKQIKYLLEKGVDPNAKLPKYGTALHQSIANEFFDTHEKHHISKYLINCLHQYHYDWNLQDYEGKTPLILAAKVRSPDLVKQLAEKKTRDKENIDLNIQDHQGRTALHFACALGDRESVMALLSAGASIEIPDQQKKLPLDYTKLDKTSVRNILHEIHIDPDRDENAINNHVLKRDTYQPVQIFDIEKNVTIPFFSRKTDWEKFGKDLIDKIKIKPYQEEKWRTHDLKFFKMQGNFSGKPLIDACIEGQKSTRYCLLAHIAKKPLTYTQLLEKTKEKLKNDPTIQSFLGFIESQNFPRALREISAKGNNELAAMLIAYVVNTNLPIKDYINQPSTNGKTTLHWAAFSARQTNDNSLVDLLLTYEPDTTIRDKANNLYLEYLQADTLKTTDAINAENTSMVNDLPNTNNPSNNVFDEEQDDFGMGCSLL